MFSSINLVIYVDYEHAHKLCTKCFEESNHRILRLCESLSAFAIDKWKEINVVIKMVCFAKKHNILF
jgi:hypothetical protein